VIVNPPDSLSNGDPVRLAPPAGTVASAAGNTEQANG
jgi:multidrug efflux system membrane fusion protein